MRPDQPGNWLDRRSRAPGFGTDFKGARQELADLQGGDTTVGLDVLLYAGQHQGSEMIMFGNELVNADNKTWKILSGGPRFDGRRRRPWPVCHPVRRQGPGGDAVGAPELLDRGAIGRAIRAGQVLPGPREDPRAGRPLGGRGYPTAMDLETDVASAALDSFTRSHRTAIESMLAEASAAASPVDSR